MNISAHGILFFMFETIVKYSPDRLLLWLIWRMSRILTYHLMTLRIPLSACETWQPVEYCENRVVCHDQTMLRS